MTLQPVPNQGRGFVARRQIRKGQQLLQIPETLLLTATKALEECALGQLLKDASLPDWTVMATYLVQLYCEQQQGKSGYWGAYIAILPEKTGCILEWTQKEVSVSLSRKLSTHNVIQSQHSAPLEHTYTSHCHGWC